MDPVKSEHVSAVRAIVKECEGKFDTMVVLGIGGSALGNIAVQSALNPGTYNLLSDSNRPGPRLFVVDNVDPANFKAVLDYCQSMPGGLERTLFNVISKSGETAETAAQFMIIRDMLQRALGPDFTQHIVAITDPAKGTMRQICDRDGYRHPARARRRGRTLQRPLARGPLLRRDVRHRYRRAARGRGGDGQALLRPGLLENPAAMLAFLLVELGTNKGKPNHVMMPYCNGLYLLADWYRQLVGREPRQGKGQVAGRRSSRGSRPSRPWAPPTSTRRCSSIAKGPTTRSSAWSRSRSSIATSDIPRGWASRR
jgi:glucose-6-phosphate isomerase